MNHGLSDQVRSVAADKYVQPAIRAGKLRFSVAVRDLMRHLEPLGFPARNWPQICTAIQAEKFLRAHGIEIEAIDGPPKKQSPTVVVRYRVRGTSTEPALAEARGRRELGSRPEEDPGAGRIETDGKASRSPKGGICGIRRRRGIPAMGHDRKMRMRHEPNLLGHDALYLPAGGSPGILGARARELLARAHRRGDSLYTSYLALGEMMAGAGKSPDPQKACGRCAKPLDEMGFSFLPFDAGAVAPFSKLRDRSRS